MSVGKVATIVGILGTAIPGGMYIHGYFAHKADLAELSADYRRHVAEQQQTATQEKLWMVQDRIKEVGPKPELIEKERELEFQLKRIDKQLDEIGKEKN